MTFIRPVQRAKPWRLVALRMLNIEAQNMPKTSVRCSLFEDHRINTNSLTQNPQMSCHRCHKIPKNIRCCDVSNLIRDMNRLHVDRGCTDRARPGEEGWDALR